MIGFLLEEALMRPDDHDLLKEDYRGTDKMNFFTRAIKRNWILNSSFFLGAIYLTVLQGSTRRSRSRQPSVPFISYTVISVSAAVQSTTSMKMQRTRFMNSKTYQQTFPFQPTGSVPLVSPGLLKRQCRRSVQVMSLVVQVEFKVRNSFSSQRMHQVRVYSASFPWTSDSWTRFTGYVLLISPTRILFMMRRASQPTRFTG